MIALKHLERAHGALVPNVRSARFIKPIRFVICILLSPNLVCE